MNEQRILGFDLARALAFAGMVVVNFRIALCGTATEPAWLRSAAGLLDGRAAATFVVLAGIGLSLMARRARESADPVARGRVRREVLWRGGFLLVVGALHTTIWIADILHFYGLWLVICAGALFAPARALWLAAAAVTLSFPLLAISLDYEAGWNWNTFEYEGFWSAEGTPRRLFFNGFHPTLPWLAFALLGLRLGRLDWTDARIRRRCLVLGIVVALLAEGAAAVLGALPNTPAGEAESWRVLLGSAPMPPGPLYVLAAAGTACAVISLCVGASLRWPRASWSLPLARTGQMALTLYVLHVVVGVGVLLDAGVAGPDQLAAAMGGAVGFVLLSILGSALYRRRFSRGPLEALMRWRFGAR